MLNSKNIRTFAENLRKSAAFGIAQTSLALLSFARPLQSNCELYKIYMVDENKIQIFDGQKVRTAWNEDEQKWYFSIVDVCWILTDQPDLEHARNYWKVLKHRLASEGFQSVTNCNQQKSIRLSAIC